MLIGEEDSEKGLLRGRQHQHTEPLTDVETLVHEKNVQEQEKVYKKAVKDEPLKIGSVVTLKIHKKQRLSTENLRLSCRIVGIRNGLFYKLICRNSSLAQLYSQQQL